MHWPETVCIIEDHRGGTNCVNGSQVHDMQNVNYDIGQMLSCLGSKGVKLSNIACISFSFLN